MELLVKMADYDGCFIECVQNLSISESNNNNTNFIEYLNELMPSVQQFTEMLKIKENREKLGPSEWSFLRSIVLAANNSLHEDSVVPFSSLNIYTEIFRCLRNASAGILSNQKLILSSVFNEAMKIFEYILQLYFSEQHKNDKRVITALRCGLQFVGNLVCQCPEAQEVVWTIFYVSCKYFNALLPSQDCKVQEYTAMIFYNCLTPEHRTEIINNNIDIINMLAHLLMATDNEWSLFALEFCLYDEDFLRKCYSLLPIKSRLLLLDIIAEKLSDIARSHDLPESMIFFLCDSFNAKAMNIVKICSYFDDDLEPVEILKLLSLLCRMSLLPNYSKIKTSLKLLETAVDILKTVHLLGKTGNNQFSPIIDIKSENPVADLESCPTYGFKRDLIKLIGNMCADCSLTQNAAREMDVLPLVLDCCNIDNRNPYILQWCILAIKNLLYRNQENQAVLASMTVHGGIAESALLKELGLKVEEREGKLFLVSI